MLELTTRRPPRGALASLWVRALGVEIWRAAPGRCLPEEEGANGGYDERREAGEDQRIAQRQQVHREIEAAACIAIASAAEHEVSRIRSFPSTTTVQQSSACHRVAAHDLRFAIQGHDLL